MINNKTYSIHIDRYTIGIRPYSRLCVSDMELIGSELTNDVMTRIEEQFTDTYEHKVEPIRKGRYNKIVTYKTKEIRVAILYERNRASLFNEAYINNIGVVQFTCRSKNNYDEYNAQVCDIEEILRSDDYECSPQTIEIALDIYDYDNGIQIARNIIPRYWRGHRPKDAKVSVKNQYFGKSRATKQTHCYHKVEIDGVRVEIRMIGSTARKYFRNMEDAIKRKDDVLFETLEVWEPDFKKMKEIYGDKRWYRDMRKRNVPASELLENLVREIVQIRSKVKGRFFTRKDLKLLLMDIQR
jgi:hypothetical protein